MSALRTHTSPTLLRPGSPRPSPFATTFVGMLCRRSDCLDQVRSDPQFQAFSCEIATLHQLGVSLDYLKGCLLSLTPKTNVKHMLADAKIMHRKIRQPSGKIWVDVKFVVRRSRKESQ